VKNLDSSQPLPYPRTVELNITALMEAVDDKKKSLKLSDREVIRRLGERSSSRLLILRKGGHPSTDLFIRILLWLGTTDIAPFIQDIE
jgi:hypothetical protein